MMRSPQVIFRRLDCKKITNDKNILVEFGNWFEKVQSKKIRSVSEEIKNNAVIEKIQKTR